MKVIILAGGSGTRLWPLSRLAYPKQFLRFGDEPSLLERTLHLFLKFCKIEDIYIITSENYLYLTKSQAKGIASGLEDQIIVEFEKKGTGPAIALAVKYLQEKGFSPKENVLIASSDHMISPEEKFIDYIMSAETLAKMDKIVLFGIKPNKPETGYGYIKVKPLPGNSYLEVERFVEKPSLKVAENYIRDGNHLWNCGLFAFNIKTFLEEVEKHATTIFQWIQGDLEQRKRDYSNLPTISIDHALMEKSSNLAVIPMDINWGDLGCWDSIFDIFHKDSNQNVKIGNILDIDTNNSIIIGGKRLISTIGIDEMVIVDTDDALFLGKKGETQRVKQLVEKMKIQERKEVQEHVTTFRPWGSYIVLEENSAFKVKKISINPGQKISLQYHLHRSEHWVVVKGIARVTKGSEAFVLQSNESIYIPQTIIHRLENIGSELLEIIEVQTGQYLGEDDIVRLEDMYDRLDALQLTCSQ